MFTNSQKNYYYYADTEKDTDLQQGERQPLVPETLAKGERTVTIDAISYGWVANTYTHYHRIEIDGEGAEYELRFRNDLPQRIRLTPICRFLFDGLYPEHFHGKVIK